MVKTAIAKASQQEKTTHEGERSQDPSRTGKFTGPHADILTLQRLAGNRAVSGIIQPKLKMGSPGDRYEQEADHVAEQVMSMATPTTPSMPRETEEGESETEEIRLKSLVEKITPVTQRQEKPGDEEPIQNKCETCEQEEHIQRSSNTTVQARPDFESRLNATKRSGNPLPDKVRSFMEMRFGSDFSQVRVHTGSDAVQMNQELGAQAFTYSSDIYYGQGKAPATDTLTAHELTHVLQQRSLSESQSRRVKLTKQEVNRDAALKGLSISKLNSVTFGIQRDPDPKAPAQASDPIQESDFPEYWWRTTYTEFYQNPTLDQVKDVLTSQGWISVEIINASKATFVSRGPLIPYWSFKHPTLGVVARAGVQIGGSSEAKGKFQTIYVYALISNPSQKNKGTSEEQKSASSSPPDTSSKGEKTTKSTTDSKASPTTEGGGTPTTTIPKSTNDSKGSTTVPSKNSENLTKLKVQPEKIKLLLGGESTFTLEKSEQLLRIAEKLQKLKPEDLELYKLLVTHLTKDLNAFEQSIDVYLKVKEQYRAKLEEAAKQKQQQQKKEPTLEEKLAKPFEGFDTQKFGIMQRNEKEALARKIADQQTQIQLQHMAENPGETVKGMAESVVRVDQLAKGVYQDVKEATSGDKNAFARWAGGVGATGKLSGWVAAVAGIVYVGLLFVPGVNVAVLAKTAMTLMVATIILSSVEAELRVQAAAEAKTPEEFQVQTTKAAAAQANVAMAIAMLVFSLVLKVIARTPIPGRLQTVGGALKAARAALLEKTGVGAALDSIRASLLKKLKDIRSEIPKGVTDANKNLTEWTKLVEGMTGDELVKKLAAGDQALQDLTNIPPEVAKQIQDIANTPAGKGIADKLRADVLKALKDAPTETEKQLSNVSDKLDKAINDIEKAKTPEDLKNALDTAEKGLSPEALGKEAEASKQAYVKEKITAERYKGMSDAEVKSAAMTDPVAVDELIRRYELKTVKELEKLSKAGDGTADYVLGKRRSAGYKKPAEVPLRPSNLLVLDRLKARLSKLRQSSGVSKEGSSGGTIGVAETDLPLQKNTFEGASPKAGGQPDPTYKPPTEFPKAQGHAEQNLVGAIKKAILEAKLTPEQMKGKTVYMLIEQEVCPTCKAGLYNEGAGAGVLKQFSSEFPNITVEVMNLETGEVLRFGGK